MTGGDRFEEGNIFGDMKDMWEWDVGMVNLKDGCELTEVGEVVWVEIGKDGGDFLGEGEFGVVDDGE